MRTFFLCAFLAVSVDGPRLVLADPPANEVSRSVVKVYSTQRKPDLNRPWLRHPQEDFSGSGVVIEGRRIVTNAQVVKYSSQVLVEPDRTGEKLAARVEFLADDVDLAVLRLEDPAFFDTHPPLVRHPDRPKIKDILFTYGFPLGGENLSITRGIVSRIEFEEFYYGTMGLKIQVDAAINAGNSGGPALIDDKMIGIVFNRFSEADNIGYIIPNEEIDLFLKDIADGTYDGKPQIVEILNSVQNKALRAALKLPKDVNGLVCRDPSKVFAASTLKPMDVVTAVGEHPIDAAGKVKVDNDLHLDYRFYVQVLAKDGGVPVKVVRDGARIDLNLRVLNGPYRHKLMPSLMGREPSYFVWGPIAFVAATDDYLVEFDHENSAAQWYPYLTYNQNIMIARRGELPGFEGEQLVAASAFLPHRVSKGYSSPISFVVDALDGTKVRNLRHFGELLRDARGENVTITFRDKSSEVFVFNVKEVAASREEILNENGIRNACSADLKDLFAPIP